MRTPFKVSAAWILASTLWPAMAEAQPVSQGMTVWSGNGHQYEVFHDAAGITWAAAQQFALGRGGHLVTITAPGEQLFLYPQISLSAHPHLWTNAFNGVLGPWIGLRQVCPPTCGASCEPACGWQWVTGESLSYNNWGPTQPNNGGPIGDENACHFLLDPNLTGSQPSDWNDLAGGFPLKGFIVEYEGLSMSGGPTTISISSGGTQSMQVSCGNETCPTPTYYWVLGSINGTMPGMSVAPGLMLPLNVDGFPYSGYFYFTFLNPNNVILSNSLAILPATGKALISLNIPAGMAPAALVGLKLNHAAIAFNSSGAPIAVSNSVEVMLVP